MINPHGVTAWPNGHALGGGGYVDLTGRKNPEPLPGSIVPKGWRIGIAVARLAPETTETTMMFRGIPIRIVDVSDSHGSKMSRASWYCRKKDGQ